MGVTIEQQAEVAKQVADKEQPPDLKLLISSGIPVGGAEALYGGSDHIVEATVVNTSEKPIGVNSLGLELELELQDGRWIPGFSASPSTHNTRLPAILGPQEQASVWWDHDALRDVIAEQGGHEIKAIMANLRDGSKRRQNVPDDWRRLRD